MCMSLVIAIGFNLSSLKICAEISLVMEEDRLVEMHLRGVRDE